MSLALCSSCLIGMFREKKKGEEIIRKLVKTLQKSGDLFCCECSNFWSYLNYKFQSEQIVDPLRVDHKTVLFFCFCFGSGIRYSDQAMDHMFRKDS